eukprot:2642506-Alexandrium_andersonii.AAC.1
MPTGAAPLPMLAMRGHGHRAVVWHVPRTTPSAGRVEAFHAGRSSLMHYLCRACVPETSGARLGYFAVLGALLGPAPWRARLVLCCSGQVPATRLAGCSR